MSGEFCEIQSTRHDNYIALSIGVSEYNIALSTFERVRAMFPGLVMNLDLHPLRVELAMDIPTQPGLLFNVHLNLQNGDELHLNAPGFWVEWFPCTKPERVEKYYEAVSGLLSGRFRILQRCRGTRVVKASLQCPTRGRWKTITGCWHLWSFPWPPKTFKVVQNLPPVQPLR